MKSEIKNSELAGGWGWEVPKDRPLRIVFMGTPEFAVPALRALVEETPHRVVAVYTQPDRPKGRGRKLQPPPVKEYALQREIPVYQPEKMTSRESYQRLLSDSPDLIVVVAYGKILRPRVLRVPPFGAINCHASLLPKYRGAAPIFWTLYNGETETGITTMWMNAGMDEGPILLQKKIQIRPDETYGELHDRLAKLSAELLVQTLESLVNGTLNITPQEEEGITLAPMLKKKDFALNFERTARELHNHIRALDPIPGGRAILEGDRPVKLFNSHLAKPSGTYGSPGEIISVSPDKIEIAAGEGTVEIREIQLSGKKKLPIKTFLVGTPLKPGMKFTSIPSEPENNAK